MGSLKDLVIYIKYRNGEISQSTKCDLVTRQKRMRAHTPVQSRSKMHQKGKQMQEKKNPTCTLTIKHTHVHTKNEHTDFEKAINSR